MKINMTICLLALAAIFPVVAAPTAGSLATDKPVAVQFSHEGRTVHGLLWGTGPYGVILSHGAIYDAASWSPLASEIARNGMAALALEEVAAEDLLAAHAYLKEKLAVKATALIGASAGGRTALVAMARSPQAWDQLILLSCVGDVSRLGPAPKLFVVSKGEGMAKTVQQMAKEAPGTRNDLLLLKGSAHAQAIFRSAEGPHLTEVILQRLLKRSQPAQ